jgi:hypothetical protein
MSGLVFKDEVVADHLQAQLAQAEEEAAYFRQMNERLIAQLERQAAEIEQLKLVCKLPAEL